MTRLALLLCLCAVAVSAAPAEAAKVRVRTYEELPDPDVFDREDVGTEFAELRFRAGDGEPNRVTMRPGGHGRVRVTDRRAILRAGGGCRRLNPHTSLCRMGGAF